MKQRAMENKRGYISRGDILMKYKVKLERSEEGVAASVPGLPGCWSQGETEDEAIRNIEDAIRDYLDVIAEQLKGAAS
jgi:predicted RNase H-like HicB family nuclease